VEDASQLAAARVVNENGQPELVQLARERLERGIVVGGELRDPNALAIALSDFFKKNRLPKRNVRLGVANNRIGVRTFDITGVTDPAQLDNAVRFRAQETLPIPIDDAVLDYQILNHTKKENGEDTKRILLVVAYRELVDHYVVACRKAGIDLVGIDLEAFALLRAMGAPGDIESGAALIVVAVGHDRSTFAVSNGRACEFTRVLEWGGSSLDVALGRALDIEPSEAESLKRTIDLETTTPPPGLTESQLETAQDAIRRQIQTFARDLVSSLQFYQNQANSLGIAEIVLTGGTAHLPGLAEELREVAFARAGEARLVGRVGVELADRVPVRAQRPLAAGVIPYACRHHAAASRDALHLADALAGIGHEVDDELRERGFEVAVAERQLFRGCDASVDPLVPCSCGFDELLRRIDG